MKNKNPLNPKEKDMRKANTAYRVEPDLETDKFSEDEQKKIVRMVLDDHAAGLKALDRYFNERRMDIKHYMGEKPSVLENKKKEDWQSDRNMKLCAAISDMLVAVLLGTVWNPDTIRPVPTEENDINNAENIADFMKWGVGKSESDVFKDIADHVHNRVTQGFACFHINWKVWYEWVDKRVPKKNIWNKISGYNIKEEKMRFEKGLITNIPNVEDIITIDYGKSLQDVPFLIHVLHLTGGDITKGIKRNLYMNMTEEKVKKLENACYEWKRKQISKEKASQLKVEHIDDLDLRQFPVDVLAWHGEYEKNDKTEEYRFLVEPSTETLLAGKPLRKITRTGKRPYVGGGFIRIPGQIRGISLPTYGRDIFNAINNTYNQKADFQTITNLMFGFYNSEMEGQIPPTYKIKPGKMYPLSSSPLKDNIYFPNLQRSMAWADNDMAFLLEILERLTGAASYFLTYNRGTSGTATRDMIINEKTETRFSLWVKTIMDDITEALTMYLNMYQDWAPPDLAKRVLGENAKPLIDNLSIATLRGKHNIQMQPDLVSGSKALEAQLQTLILQASQNCMWLDPQINPKGNYQLWADYLRKVGREKDVEKYLGKKPKGQMGDLEEIDKEWTRFKQGEDFDPPEGDTGMAMQHLQGHMKQKEEKYHELDEEYKPNFDAHLFKTMINTQKLMQRVETERAANAQAAQFIQNDQPGQRPPQQPQAAPGQAQPQQGMQEPAPPGIGPGQGGPGV